MLSPRSCSALNWLTVCPVAVIAGVDLWKRNLQLLVPFLVQPSIELLATRIRQDSSPCEVEVCCLRERHVLWLHPLAMCRAICCEAASTVGLRVAGATTASASCLLGNIVSTPCLQAEWKLSTGLALPWKPFVQILGRTVYTLNADANQVRAVSL